jgi:predicted RNA-binding Zn-ribbon protein involved in translation (DUF1610 family)
VTNEEKKVAKENAEELSKLRFGCPHCGSHMRIRSSRTPLSIYREIIFHCTNEWACGFRCNGDLTLKHTLSPSRCPNPDVGLETSPRVMQQLRMGMYASNDPNYDEEPK